MTIKSINDEIRKTEKELKEDKEEISNDYIKKYELEARIKTLKEVKELIELVTKRAHYSLTKDNWNTIVVESIKNEILGSSNEKR